MSPSRKLKDKEEKDVALSYLCGVHPKYLQVTKGISSATLRTKILKERSLHWNDPLVEFYRDSEKSRNFAHFQLAYNRRDVSHRGLVNPPLHRRVYDNITESIYVPETEKIARELALEKYAYPSCGLERLLSAVLDPRTPQNVLEPLFLKTLESRYALEQRFSLQDVFREIEQKTVEKLKQGGLWITPKKQNVIDEALETLDEREKGILTLYFGLEGEEERTFKEVGDSYSIGPEWARQIQEHAIRKLKHFLRSRKLEIVHALATDGDIEHYLANLQQQEILQHRLTKYRLSEIPVKEIEWNIRTKNCLHVAGFSNLAELEQKTDEELLKCRNMGRRSVREIRDIIAQFS